MSVQPWHHAPKTNNCYKKQPAGATLRIALRYQNGETRAKTCRANCARFARPTRENAPKTQMNKQMTMQQQKEQRKTNNYETTRNKAQTNKSENNANEMDQTKCIAWRCNSCVNVIQRCVFTRRNSTNNIHKLMCVPLSHSTMCGKRNNTCKHTGGPNRATTGATMVILQFHEMCKLM